MGAGDALEIAHKHLLPDIQHQIELGHLLTVRALFAYLLGQLEPTQAMLEHSLKILRPLNEPRVLIEPLTFLGTVMILIGNYSRAIELLDEGLEKAIAVGDRWFEGMCLSQEVYAGIIVGKYENAHERMHSAVA